MIYEADAILADEISYRRLFFLLVVLVLSKPLVVVVLTTQPGFKTLAEIKFNIISHRNKYEALKCVS